MCVNLLRHCQRILCLLLGESQQLVFYVEEESDDFTFFVRDADGAVLEKLKEIAKSNTSDPTIKRSFAERIYVKNLILTEDAITIADSFWSTLLSAKVPHNKYLVNRLDITTADCLERVVSGLAKPDDAKALEVALLNTLNEQGFFCR